MQTTTTEQLQATLEEYRALRAEACGIMERQYSMLSWSLSAVTVLFGAVIASWEKLLVYPWMLVAICSVIAPALCTAYSLSWSHLMVKLAMLGSHLHVVEEKVAALLRPNDFDPQSPILMPMSWEHYANDPKTYGYEDGRTLVSRSILAIHLVLQIAGGCLFWFLCWPKLHVAERIGAGGVLVIVAVLWVVGWHRLFRLVKRRIDAAVKHRSEFQDNYTLAAKAAQAGR